MGFIRPSKFQSDLISKTIEDDRNLIVRSSPGTGKTIACCIAALSHVDTGRYYPQVLFLCATYEAAVQTTVCLRQMVMQTGIKVGFVRQDTNGNSNCMFFQFKSRINFNNNKME